MKAFGEDDLPDHPDLRAMAARLERELGQALEAEWEAATRRAARRSTLRDRLIQAEGRIVVIHWLGGESAAGLLSAVGIDYLELTGPDGVLLVPLLLIERVRLEP